MLGAGMRHLRRHLAMRFEKLEMFDHRMAGEIDLAGDLERLGLGLDAMEFDRRRADPLDALQAPEKIEMPPRAAEFAVGRELQAHLGLFLDDFLDLTVFDIFQRGGRNLAFGEFRARLFQRRGAQQAADHVGAEGRRGALHVVSPRHSFSFCRPGRAKRGPGPILRDLSRVHGVWVPAFAGTTFSGPTPRSPVRRSSSASPIVRLLPAHCPPRSRRSRIAATGTADRARRTWSLPGCAS